MAEATFRIWRGDRGGGRLEESFVGLSNYWLVFRSVDDEPHLVAYSGIALEGEQCRWLDVHHSDASKGGAVRLLKDMLGLERVICFGDSDNDLSMFEAADEGYAPANANDSIKSAATAIIGHHDEEGIARFLRDRFALDES